MIQSCPGVIWTPVPSSSYSPLPHPRVPRTFRHVPGPRRSGVARSSEGVEAGVGNINKHHTAHTKAPIAKTTVHASQAEHGSPR